MSPHIGIFKREFNHKKFRKKRVLEADFCNMLATTIAVSTTEANINIMTNMVAMREEEIFKLIAQHNAATATALTNTIVTGPASTIRPTFLGVSLM